MLNLYVDHCIENNPQDKANARPYWPYTLQASERLKPNSSNGNGPTKRPRAMDLLGNGHTSRYSDDIDLN